MKKLLPLVSLIGFVFNISACNTMEGVGRDVQAGGKALEKAADKAKPK